VQVAVLHSMEQSEAGRVEQAKVVIMEAGHKYYYLDSKLK
jgi:hypothetical protein